MECSWPGYSDAALDEPDYQRESETKPRIVGWKGREVLPGPIRTVVSGQSPGRRSLLHLWLKPPFPSATALYGAASSPAMKHSRIPGCQTSGTSWTSYY